MQNQYYKLLGWSIIKCYQETVRSFTFSFGNYKRNRPAHTLANWGERTKWIGRTAPNHELEACFALKSGFAGLWSHYAYQLCLQVSVDGYVHLKLLQQWSPGAFKCLLVLEFAACPPTMSNEVETSTTNGQPDQQQAATKAPSKKEKKKGRK